MPQKVEVAFEFDLKDVTAMIEARSPESAKLSKAEVEAMAKAGTLRASDLLTKAEIGSVVGLVATLKFMDSGVVKQSAMQAIKKAASSRIEVPTIKKLLDVKAQVMYKAEKQPMSAMQVTGGARQKAARKS